jgi:toxin ParE1/3/4
MNRADVVFREEASADLADIYRWVNESSLDPLTAERFVARLVVACERIGDRPLGGRARDDLFPGLRTFPFERKAVIAYLVRGETVEITNVFYGGRDYEALYAANPAASVFGPRS